VTIADRPPRPALLAERKKLGLTQEELADKIGCARASYALWEQGKARPMPRYWPVMAELFGLSGAEMARIIDHTGAPDLEGHDIPDWLNHRESLILSAGTLTTIVRDAVPGMLQTKAYAKVIERLGALPLNDDEILERVDMRMALQDVVHRSKDPLKVLAFIAEIVLWEEADSAEVMAVTSSRWGSSAT
jgi:transcriptional regulator with XRE-family HTH domain